MQAFLRFVSRFSQTDPLTSQHHHHHHLDIHPQNQELKRAPAGERKALEDKLVRNTRRALCIISFGCGVWKGPSPARLIRHTCMPHTVQRKVERALATLKSINRVHVQEGERHRVRQEQAMQAYRDARKAHEVRMDGWMGVCVCD